MSRGGREGVGVSRRGSRRGVADLPIQVGATGRVPGLRGVGQSSSGIPGKQWRTLLNEILFKY